MTTEVLRDRVMTHLKLRFTIPERFEEEFVRIIEEHIRNASQLNRVSMVSITKQFRKGLEKDDWPEVKYMWKAIFVLILRDYKAHLVLNDEEVFLQQYPEFVECSLEERKLLLDFKNMMVLSLQIIDPRNHKGEMMTLVGHLCGTVVVTGGGQTAATDRRVLCYERETGILPRKLPERRRKIDKVLLPWTVSANQYIPLPGKVNAHTHSNNTSTQAAHTSTQAASTQAASSSSSSSGGGGASSSSGAKATKPEPPPAEILSLATKKGRFSLPDTKSLLKCADSFWNYHRSLMEANQDIPYQPVAVGCVADIHKFPSHDIFYTPHISINPNGTANTTKLRSFFANLPKIEGVFAPVLDPSVTDTSIPLIKPGMRDTQEARRVAKDVQPAVRDYHRVSSRAPSNRTKARNANFGKPIAPAPLPLSMINSTAKAQTMSMPLNATLLKPAAGTSTASATSSSSLRTPATTAATQSSNTASSSPHGSSCDVSIRSLSESDDDLDLDLQVAPPPPPSTAPPGSAPPSTAPLDTASPTTVGPPTIGTPSTNAPSKDMPSTSFPSIGASGTDALNPTSIEAPSTEAPSTGSSDSDLIKPPSTIAPAVADASAPVSTTVGVKRVLRSRSIDETAKKIKPDPQPDFDTDADDINSLASE